MHRRSLSRMGMEEIVEFLQIRLEQNFGYTDNVAVENVQACLEDLKRLKLDFTAKQTPSSELPQNPFGVFQTPSVDVSLGRRRVEFTQEELAAQAAVLEMQVRVTFSGFLAVKQKNNVSLSLATISTTRVLSFNRRRIV